MVSCVGVGVVYTDLPRHVSHRRRL